jgi:hypothetical protein
MAMVARAVETRAMARRAVEKVKRAVAVEKVKRALEKVDRAVEQVNRVVARLTRAMSGQTSGGGLVVHQLVVEKVVVEKVVVEKVLKREPKPLRNRRKIGFQRQASHHLLKP